MGRRVRTGRYEVYKMPASVGPAVQVTKDGGRVAEESQDGAWLYYSKSSIGGVWRIPSSGGKEELVVNRRRLRHCLLLLTFAYAFF
jgi:hypothetical protein